MYKNGLVIKGLLFANILKCEYNCLALIFVVYFYLLNVLKVGWHQTDKGIPYYIEMLCYGVSCYTIVYYIEKCYGVSWYTIGYY